MLASIGAMLRRMILQDHGSPDDHGPDDHTSDTSSVMADNEAVDETSSGSQSHVFEPTVLDVIVVKAMLIKAMRLPSEIADLVVDLAEYWPHCTARLDFPGEDLRVRGAGDEEDKFLLRTQPLGMRRWNQDSRHDPAVSSIHTAPASPKPPREEFPVQAFQEAINSPVTLIAQPCRRIVFTIESRDQGWGGEFEHHDTYNGSWTWFEAGLERWCKRGTTGGALSEGKPEQPSLQLGDISTVHPPVVWRDEVGYAFEHPLFADEDHTIQKNITACKTMQTHRVVWSYTDNESASSTTEGREELARVGRGKGTGNGAFVRNLKLGDVVTVWAKARFPGWVNRIKSIQVDVYWVL